MQNSLEMVALTIDQIKANAPQAFATQPKPGVSAKYSFLPTERIISDMDRLGWKVNQAKSNRNRSSAAKEFGNHVVKFFHPDVFMKDQDGNIEAYVNIVVINNHMGTGSFKFEMGVFRLVCENGLTIRDKDMGGFNMRHSGYSFEQLKETIDQAMNQLPSVVSKINSFNQIIMSKEQQHEFAQKAFALRSYQDRQLTESELEEFLTPRRREDEGDSLWVVFNKIQESVIRGGYHITNKKNKIRRAKSIKNIQQDLKLNLDLWEMAESYS
jgi:hypothetical protein